MLDSTKVASSSVHESSLLATCFGNRSAVLYELGKFEVASHFVFSWSKNVFLNYGRKAF